MNQSLNTGTGAGQQPTHLSQGNKGSAKKGKGAKDTNARNLKTADVDPNKFLVYSVVDAIPLSNDRDLGTPKRNREHTLDMTGAQVQ